MNHIKRFLLIVITIIGLSAKSQIDCTIHVVDMLNHIHEVPEIVCFNEELELVPGTSLIPNQNYSYEWSTGETSFRIKVKISNDDTPVSVTVKDITGTALCSNEVVFKMRESFETHVEQTKLTCSDNKEPDARVKASATGNYSSFSYEWGLFAGKEWAPVQFQDTVNGEAIGLKSWMKYHVKVRNEYGCIQYDSLTTKAFANPDVEISSDPSDTVYLQRPTVTYSFENLSDSINISNFYWQFMNDPDAGTFDEQTSTSETPSYIYAKDSNNKYIINLNVTSEEHGCDTTFSAEMLVLPVKLKIPNIFTPNGDGINDYFIIGYDDSGSEPESRAEYEKYKTLNDYYESSKLTIFNRWGRIVYKSSDYKNDWDGDNLPDATYFYVLECKGRYTNQRYQGSITIFASGR